MVFIRKLKEEEMLESDKSKKGITLIALIITVIVMLILAGVSLNALIGDNRTYYKCSKCFF